MLYKIYVKTTGTPDDTAWEEEYEDEEVTSTAEAEQAGKAIVDYFNNTIEKRGGQHRTFVRAEVIPVLEAVQEEEINSLLVQADNEDLKEEVFDYDDDWSPDDDDDEMSDWDSRKESM